MPGETAAALALVLTAAQRAHYVAVLPAVTQAAREARIPLDFMLGLAYVESEFNPQAVNPSTGALGLFQVMPGHRADFGWTGGNYDAWRDPLSNARAGAQLLRWHGWGKKTLRETLAGYGGFVSKSPDGYVADVKRAATGIFWARRLGHL